MREDKGNGAQVNRGNMDSLRREVRPLCVAESSADHQSGRLVIIIGAGPAGLTAAAQLCKAGIQSIVLEQDDIVGGISRTSSYKGYHFDIGGHRFFTKVKAVEDLWHEVLKDDFLVRPRVSHILYRGRFFGYPIRPLNALRGLGLRISILVFTSYLYAHFFPIRNERSFADWVTNRFGKRLFNIFFKTYTEKVWGISCSEISADWAAQRIKGLSLKFALLNALGVDKRGRKAAIKTLLDSFHYPKLGPGMMWQKVANIVEQSGGALKKGSKVARILLSATKVEAVEFESDGVTQRVVGTDFISSMPLKELIEKLDPAPPAEVQAAAAALRYRDFITIALIINREHLFEDNWIYVHDPGVKVGRVQNFKNWSPYMVPDQTRTCLGLEYFCFQGDDLWSMADAELVELAKDEMQTLGLAKRSEIEDGCVVRMPKAYPVYDDTYSEAVATIKHYLRGIDNLQTVGRNGMHKYNNQDHSMLTAMLAVENILGAKHDLWSVNTEQDYHEELTEAEVEKARQHAELLGTQPLVPKLVSSAEIIQKVFARIDKAALATAIGTVSGCLVLAATLRLVAQHEADTVAQFELLSQYFIGYTVSYRGAAIGFLYAFFWGFVFGWLFAYLRNLMLGLYIGLVVRRAQALSISRLLDYI